MSFNLYKKCFGWHIKGTVAIAPAQATAGNAAVYSPLPADRWDAAFNKKIKKANLRVYALAMLTYIAYIFAAVYCNVHSVQSSRSALDE